MKPSSAPRIYRLLLALYPPVFRRRFGDDMCELFMDRRRAPRGAWGVTALWIRTFADVARHAPAEWLSSLRPPNDSPEMRSLKQAKGTSMNAVWQDVKYAARTLIANPAFTAFAALTLALGIGATTAIFSVVDAVLLRPLPYPEPQALVKIQGLERSDRGRLGNLSRPDFKDFERRASSFENVGAHGAGIGAFTLTGAGEPERVPAVNVSAGFFRTLGTRPLLGRVFTAHEDAATPPDIVIISHALWQRRFGGDPGVVGRALTINDTPHTIVGVLGPEFRYPQPEPDKEPQAFTPLSFGGQAGRSGRSIRAIGRLKPGVTVEAAQLELTAITAQLEAEYPQTNYQITAVVRGLADAIAGGSRRALLMLAAAVGFVLLIACANLASLLLARGTSRRKEIAIRVALGAGRWRIVRQLLTESVLLGVLGGAAGIALAALSLGLLSSLGASSIPRASEIGMDWRVLTFAALVAIATGLIFGLTPALHISRTEVQGSLSAGGRDGASVARGGVRSVLIAVEVALSLVLLIGAGLIGQGFWRLMMTEPGFSQDQVLTLQLSLPLARYEEGTQIGWYERLYDRLRALPGVRSVGAINILPLSGGYSCDGFNIVGRVLPPGQEPCAETRSISPGYFDTLGIPLISGRVFTTDDDSERPGVVIINEEMARQFFPGEDPLGQSISYNSRYPNDSRRIIGVVGNVRHFGLEREAAPEFYMPQRQNPSYHAMTLAIRVSAGFDAEAIVPAVREHVRALDPQLPLYNVRTMESLLSRSVAEPRFRTIVLAAFAGLAWLLAIAGVYGVVAYLVGQRTREIGIRMALGAGKPDVMRLVLTQGMRPVLAGLIGGIAAAVPLGRVAAAAITGVRPFDLLTFTAVPAALVAATLFATLVPAVRAARIDPATAIRGE